MLVLPLGYPCPVRWLNTIDPNSETHRNHPWALASAPVRPKFANKDYSCRYSSIRYCHVLRNPWVVDGE